MPEVGNRFCPGSSATDMNITINPFQQLYFSDDTQTENNFVELFSAEVLQTAIHPIFQGGNVVLSGTQGCGKTMILNLLRPEIRIAYSKLGRPFPVNEQMRNFISAGVNLTRSRITDNSLPIILDAPLSSCQILFEQVIAWRSMTMRSLICSLLNLVWPKAFSIATQVFTTFSTRSS